MPRKTNVFITIDTEHSIGGAFADPRFKPVGSNRRIYCRIRGENYGIPLIMDIADQFGLKASFFLEVLNRYYFGEAQSRSVAEYILKRGHDLQLHLHPNYLNFSMPDPASLRYSDHLNRYSLEQQKEFIAEGRNTLTRYGASHLNAFRAGNYSADDNTLTALAENHFLVDSSYNKAFIGKPCMLTRFDLPDALKIGDIYEFPVTNFSEANIFGGFRYRPLDLNGASFGQIRQVLDGAVECGVKNVTMILHSFSFVNPRDVQYQKAAPRKLIIRRFKNVCRYLSENAERFSVMPFGDLDGSRLKELVDHRGSTYPKTNALSTVFRHIEQVVDMGVSTLSQGRRE